MLNYLFPRKPNIDRIIELNRTHETHLIEMIKQINTQHKQKGLRKIADVPEPCLSPEHDPPSHIVLEPGVYEYTCPACGETKSFVIPRITT